jgi:hypothetical protein
MWFILPALFACTLFPITSFTGTFVKSLTTSECKSTELFWMFTDFVNWMNVPNFYTNDGDLPIIRLKDLKNL